MSMEDHGIDPNRQTFGGAHPVLLIGIALFILPFFNTFIGWNLPVWFNIIGIVVILIGGVLSILRN